MAEQPYYYVHTLAAFAKVLKKCSPVEDQSGRLSMANLAWMLERMGKFDRTSLDDALEAARLIGRMLATAERMGIWKPDRSKELILQDVKLGHDKPAFERKI